MKKRCPMSAWLVLVLLGGLKLYFPHDAMVLVIRRSRAHDHYVAQGGPLGLFVRWWNNLPARSDRSINLSSQELLRRQLKPLIEVSYPLHAMRNCSKTLISTQKINVKAREKAKPFKRAKPREKMTAISRAPPSRRRAFRRRAIIHPKDKKSCLKRSLDDLIEYGRSRPIALLQLLHLVERELAIVKLVAGNAGSVPVSEAVKRRNELLASSLQLARRTYNALMNYVTYYPDLAKSRVGSKFYLRLVQQNIQQYYRKLTRLLN